MKLSGRREKPAQRSTLDDRLHAIFNDKRTPGAPSALYDYVREISMSRPSEGPAWYRRIWDGLGRPARSAALVATVVAIVAGGLGLTVVLPRGADTEAGASASASATAQPSLNADLATPAIRATPTIAAKPAIAIAAGGDGACALLIGGTVECWGFNSLGSLGDGTRTDSSTPVAVSGLSGVSDITAGDSHFCALLSGGTVECWGQNFFGQLGDGKNLTDALGRRVSYSSTPVAVSRLSGVNGIAAGSDHTCAVLSGGSVECWGASDRGQLGIGNPSLGNGVDTDRPYPVGVWGLSGVSAIVAGASAVSAGGFDTCALLSGGTVKCWGANEMGQLGNGTKTEADLPLAVSGISGVSAVTVAFDHTCVLLSGGTVECWGGNNAHQLGDGSTTDSSTPVALSGLSGVSAISAGGDHTCALLSAGAVVCWGQSRGELNNQSGPPISDSSTPVAVSGLSGVTAISAGGDYTCALLSGGAVECWGSNSFGQLGNGTETDSSSPVSVSGL